MHFAHLSASSIKSLKTRTHSKALRASNQVHDTL
jgi:hypothetical protein